MTQELNDSAMMMKEIASRILMGSLSLVVMVKGNPKRSHLSDKIRVEGFTI